ncbi:hypothetical protein V8D89_015879 [Ganoderma adspersum]
MAVTSSTGPCHCDNCKQPGAFTSSVIFHVGLFTSPFLLQNRLASLYWADNATWEADLDAHKVPWCSKDTRSSYVNIFAYSKQPLADCADFFNHVPIYFAQDSLWHNLQMKVGGRVPFLAAVKWLTWTEREDQNGKHISRRVLPLVGKLTAYLLAADLVYMGQVKPPDVAVMGSMIGSLAAGARDGLQAAGQLRPGNPPEEDIIDAFTRVYGYLEEQELIGFDTIMVEHLLCKYQRVHRALSGKPGLEEFVALDTVT